MRARSRTASAPVVVHARKKAAHRRLGVFLRHEALLNEHPRDILDAASAIDERHKICVDASRDRLHLEILQLRHRTVAHYEPFGHWPLARHWGRRGFLLRTPSDDRLDARVTARRRAHVWNALLADRGLAKTRLPHKRERLLE